MNYESHNFRSQWVLTGERLKLDFFFLFTQNDDDDDVGGGDGGDCFWGRVIWHYV